MNAEIRGDRVKILGKSLQCLSRLGNDLYIEAFRDKVR